MQINDAFVPPLSRKEIEERAEAWRHTFDIRNNWVPDLLRIFEHILPQLLPQFSLVVVEDDEMMGDAARTAFLPPTIYVRTKFYEDARKAKGPARFTLAHELGHLCLHSGKSVARGMQFTRKRVTDRSRSAEWQADAFAAAFLMPRHIVQQFTSPHELMISCKVSARAAENRMRQLGMWPKARKVPDVVRQFLREHGVDGW